MKRHPLKRLDKRRLRGWLALFFVSLAIPAALLIQQSYSRLKWEAFHRHQALAEELTRRISNQLQRLVDAEERRPFTDYAFLNVAGVPAANFLQRSALSRFPVQADFPGVIGYFQVDAEGRLSTPLLPTDIDKAKAYGIGETELAERAALETRIQAILSENRLVKGRPLEAERKAKGTGGLRADARYEAADADSESLPSKEAPAAALPAPEGQAVFDTLKNAAPQKSRQDRSLGRLDDIKLRRTFSKEAEKPSDGSGEKIVSSIAAKKARTEQNALPEPVPEAAAVSGRARDEIAQPKAALQPAAKDLRIRTFESALDPFEFSRLESGELVLFRKVWLDGRRFVQGMLIDKEVFLQGSVLAAFRETALSQASGLLVVLQGDVLAAYAGRAPQGYLSRAAEAEGELLYRNALADPFGEVELVFSITRLPLGPGGRVMLWLAAVLSAVLLAGFWLMYRLGVSQIDLVNQQQDFVSAVSHELKTPLTSIRMYGEMLQAGWVEENRKKAYYDFILDESERLTRLINNVLQLARLTRNRIDPELNSLQAAELMDLVRSKIASQAERAGFALELACPPEAANARIRINPDWFVQIMINLADNAIKFSAKAETRRIDVACRRLGNRIRFEVRDYGPGVARDQLKKIFRLFYRAESELTRETVGTGIGLALAQQMTAAMHGRIDVVNREPGAEFRIDFPVEKAA